MKRPHVAIFTNLGNGHVYPTLGVCTELVSRGYRVTYVTDEYYSGPIQRTGAEPVIFTPARFEMAEQYRQVYSLPVYDPKRWAIAATYAYPYFIKDAIETLPQVAQIYSEETPDAILYDRYALAGRILAKRLGVPGVQLSFVVPPYKNYIVRLNGVCMAPEPIMEFSRRLDGFLSDHGIHETDSLFHIETLNLCFMPKEFHHHSEWFDSRFRFVGACLNRPFPRTWRRPDSSRPLLLVSGLSDGRDITHFQLIVKALADSECHVILSIGRRIDPEALGELPSNFEINQGSDHLEILPHVSLTICQGGVGTILESLYHGVPVVCIPTDVEQDDNSYRVAELGLGRHLHREELTIDLIRDCVAGMLRDNQLPSRVKQMQQVFRRSGGAHAAVDSIECLLGIK